MRSRFISVLSVLLTSLSFSFSASGQSQPPVLTNDVMGGTGGRLEYVDLSGGGVNWSIPLFNIKGRGKDLAFNANYSSRIWYQTLVGTTLEWTYRAPWNAGDSTFVASGGQFSNIDTCILTNGLTGHIRAGYNLTTLFSDGAQHGFPSFHVYLPTSPACRTGTLPTYQNNNGPLYSIVRSSVEANDKFGDGTSTTRDSNGNSIGPNDSAGRPLPVYQNGSLGKVSSITLPDGAGYTLNWTTVTANPQLPGIFGCPSPCNVTVLSSITMPNNQTWTFTHANNSYAELTKVTLPTGGYIRYDYQLVSNFPGSQNAYVVTGRHVSIDGVSEQPATTYGYSTGTQGQRVVTETDPLGNKIVHTFASFGLKWVETDTKNYDASSNLLEERQTSYASDGVPGSIQFAGSVAAQDFHVIIGLVTANVRKTDELTTLYTSGSASVTKKAHYDYDQSLSGSYPSIAYAQVDSGIHLQTNTYTASRGNITRVLEYDWGPGTTPGTLLRETDFTYLTTNSANGNIDYSSAAYNIVDRPTSKVIKDGSGNIVAQTTYEYDGSQLIATSGALQHDYTNYSTSNRVRGNLTAIKKWVNTTGQWITTSNTYDDLGNLRTTTDPLGNITNFYYDDNFSDGLNHNAQAYLTKTQAPDTTTNGTVTHHILQNSYYYASALPYQSIGENGEITTFKYDLMNRATEVDYPDGGKTTNAYNDAAYNPSIPSPSTTTTKTITSSTNLTTLTAFDGLGHTVRGVLTSDPDCASGDRTDTTYDVLGRVASVSNAYCTTSDPTYGLTTYAYDGLSRTTQLTEPDGSAIKNSYSGNITTVIDEAGNKRQSTNDALGRLTQVLEDPGSSPHLNFETDYQYDALDNMLCVAQKGTNSGTFTNCASVPTSWLPRNFAYDSLSRLTTSTNPESNTLPVSPFTLVPTTYIYDANGNLLSKTSPAPNQTGSLTVTLSYCYDALNRVTAKAYTLSPNTPPTCSGAPPTFPSPVATFLYDQSSCLGQPACSNIGRLTTQSSLISGVIQTSGALSYDPMGRVLTNNQCTPLNCTSGAYPVTYAYNLLGETISTNYLGGFTISQAYDSAGRPSQLSSSVMDSTHPSPLATVDSSVGYWPTGALRKIALANGLTESTAYNNRLQLCRVNVNSTGGYYSQCAGAIPNGSVQDFNYGFNVGSADNGNVATWTATGQQTFTRSFTYDSLNRLATLNQTSGGATGCSSTFSLSWTIDPWGNRTDQTVTGGTCNAFHAAVNSQNRFFGSPYQYDTAGNMINDGNHTYFYDAENHLIQVDGTLGTCSTATACYVYDASGQRVEKVTRSSQVHNFRDLLGNVLVERDQNAGWLADYIYQAGRLIVEYKNNTTYFVHPDHLGSTRLVTGLPNPTSPVQNLDYLPYGELNSSDSTITTHKFTGKERDVESGLDNFGARYNSSFFGRFMSPDPENAGAVLEAPQSWNAYSYVLNNPLNAIDPDGLDCVYLNNAGNGVESVDRNSSKEECTDPKNGGTWFEGTINSNSVRTDPNSDWVSAEGVVEPTGSNQQFSCGGSSCDQESRDAFINSITGGPSSVTVTDTSGSLSPDAAAILGEVYRRDRILSDASDVAACAAIGFVLGQGAVPPLATHAVVERAAQGLENPKTATAAARAYHTATDARFTAGGKFSKVLVPRTAKALSPALHVAGKAVNVAGWVYSGYEAYEAGKKCASQIK